mgnify:FL=1
MIMPPKSTKDGGHIERLISIAYLLTTRDEIALDELEERFNVNTQQIEEDLNQLMYCGLPPYSPDQLFDISIEDGFVSMFYNDVFIAPLKLNNSERTNATIALTRLREKTNLEEKKQIDEILLLLNSSKKQSIKIDNSSEYIDLFQKAIDKNLSVKIVYLSLNSGNLDEREIDPKKILTTASTSYIHAYCHRDKTMKLFRTDRISRVELTDHMSESDIGDTTLEINSQSQTPFVSSVKDYIILEIDKDLAWILDTYPHEIINLKNNEYKLEISNPFVAARLFLKASGSLKYISGTLDLVSILESIKTIKSRISNTYN